MKRPVFATVRAAAEELRSDPAYAHNNRHRPETDALVIQRTLSGAAFFSAGRTSRLVEEGQAMLFTHRESSRYGFPPGAATPYRHQFLALAPVPGIRDLFDRLRSDFGAIVSLSPSGEAARLFAEILRRFHDRAFEDRCHESELIYRLLIALYREQVRAARASDPLEYGRHLIHDRFRSRHNLKEIAVLCGVSREHFIRAFRRRYGEAPGALLRRLRLEYATAMLHATDLPVADIAASSGFDSPGTFARAVRRRYGAGPTALRRRPVSSGER